MAREPADDFSHRNSLGRVGTTFGLVPRYSTPPLQLLGDSGCRVSILDGDMKEGTFLKDDLDLARRVHRSLLPQRLVRDGVDIDTRYREMHLLGGDYATVYERESERVFLCICDVTGHGLAAALLAGRVNSFVRHAVAEVAHPCQVVDSLNSFFFQNFSDLGAFVTFFSLEIDLARREIRYAGCGHPPAILYCAGERRCHRLKSEHGMIGIEAEFARGCRINAVNFSPGDRLLLYTDGVSETRSREGELFGIDRIESVLQTPDMSEDSKDLLDRLFHTLDEFRHGEPRDDMLAVTASFL